MSYYSWRNNLYQKRDHTIDWDALTEDIIDAITEAEDAVYQESGGEEETLPTTTIKNLHEALASLQNLKGYIESKDVEVMVAILQFGTFREREVLISREHAPQKKAVDFLDSHSVNTPLFISGGRVKIIEKIIEAGIKIFFFKKGSSSYRRGCL